MKRTIKSKAAQREPVGYTLPDFDTYPGHLIRRCRQISVGIFLEEMAPFNITSVQYGVLAIIRARPGLDQRALVDLAAIDRSTLGTMLERLEANGLVRRVMPKHNQRVKQTFITPKGAKLLDQSAAAIDRVQERIVAPLTEAERKQLMHLLTKILQANNEASRVPVKPRAYPSEL